MVTTRCKNEKYRRIIVSSVHMHAICRIPSKDSNHQVLALLIKTTIKETINKTTLIFPIYLWATNNKFSSSPFQFFVVYAIPINVIWPLVASYFAAWSFSLLLTYGMMIGRCWWLCTVFTHSLCKSIMNNTFLMESYEGLLNRSDDQLRFEQQIETCPRSRSPTYYDRNDLRSRTAQLIPVQRFYWF